MKKQVLAIGFASMGAISGCQEEASVALNGVETVCSAQIVQRWEKRDENNNPIYEDYVEVNVAVNFEAVDKKFNLPKDRASYLTTPAVAVLEMKDGSEMTIVDSILYGFVDGQFVPEQTFFTKKIEASQIADGLPIKCYVGG